MIVQDALQCRGFVLCYGSMSALESLPNDSRMAGCEKFVIYMYAGSADVTDGLQTIHCPQKQLTNLESLAKGIVQLKAGENDVSWICINKHSRNIYFDFQLLESNTTASVVGEQKEKYILCLDKQIFCNEKPIAINSYANVKHGTEVNVVVPEGAVGLLMTQKQAE